jgi:hypothetical protein
MTTRLTQLLALPLLFSLATTDVLAAGGDEKPKPISSPFLARQDARKIAVKFRERGFTIMPVGNGDNKHSSLVFEIEVQRGLDYIVMVGIDEVIADVDLYVKDEVGNMIAQDTRNINRACVEFSASYNGTCTVIVDPAKTRLLGHFAVLLGMQAAFNN